MQFQIGRNLARQFEYADILHDDGVHAGFRNRRDRTCGFCKLMFEHQGVEREVTAHTAAMQCAHRFGEFAQLETNLGPGTEVFEPEIAGIGASLDRRVELWPMSGRTHHFGFFRERHGPLHSG